MNHELKILGVILLHLKVGRHLFFDEMRIFENFKG